MIYHLVSREEWGGAVDTGIYQPPSLASEGFIHCSTVAQLAATADTFFRDRRDLLALCIEEALLMAPLRFEPPAAGPGANRSGDFPHIYGPLNLGAVVRVVDFPCGADGTFMLPPALAER